MAMQATRIVDNVWCKLDDIERLPAKDEGTHWDDEARWQNATDVLGTLFAGRASSDPAQARAGVAGDLGGVGEMAFDFAFGELWIREELSRRDRSLVTISILAITHCTAELKIHLRGALNHGVTREEIEEVMTQLTVYGGYRTAVEGIRTAREIFARIDARASK